MHRSDLNDLIALLEMLSIVHRCADCGARLRVVRAHARVDQGADVLVARCDACADDERDRVA